MLMLIVSCSLSSPSHTLNPPFKVDWLMVVATRDEILLVAVEQGSRHGPFTVLLTPTDFAIPTDNQDVTRGAVAGTANGRIFLGSSQVQGADGMF